MKVLIAGSNEFVIKHVVNKYIKEGYKVIRICDEVIEYPEEIKRVKVYRKSLLSNDVKKIFKGNRFDEVIYIPGNDELNESFKIKNIMELAIRYKARKTVYISSQEVYGQVSEDMYEDSTLNPQSLKGYIKAECENIIDNYREKIEVLIIRMGEVYGAGYNEEIGNNQKAYMYISDFVEGLYRLSSGKFTGIYNLSQETNTGKIERDTYWKSIISKKEAKRLISEEGTSTKANNKDLKSKRINNIVATLSLYIVTMLLFLIFTWVNKMAAGSISLGEVNMMLIYITVISVVYGMNQGIAASILSIGYLLNSYSGINKDMLTLLLDYRFMSEMLICMILALIVGYYSDKRELKVKESISEVNFLKEKYNFLEKISEDVFLEKTELERQILNSENSIGKLYGIISRLDSLETEDILNNAISVMEEILDNNTIAIYSASKNSEYMRLEVKSNNDLCKMERSIRLDKSSAIYEKLIENNYYINKELQEGLPQVMGAICDGEEIKAVVTIETIAFEKMSLYYENIFKITTKLISAAINKAMAYQSVINSDKYIGNTKILNEKNFGQILGIKLKAQEEKHSSISVLELSESALKDEEISNILENTLRETDYFGYMNGKINILLSNAKKEGMDIVKDRLAGKGIKIRELSEDALCLNY